MTKFSQIAMVVVLMWAAAASVEIIADGNPVVGPGVFTQGCIYGDKASLSDHAPIVWESEGIATWNISNRVSHIPIHKPWGIFLGHKFKTASDYTLIDELGKPAIAGYKSEVAGSVHGKEVINEFFGIRLRKISQKIKELFEQHKIDYLALQEIPNRLKTDVDGKNLHEMIAEILGPELTIHFPERPPHWKDWPPDVALVTRTGVSLKMSRVDAHNRLQPYCIQEKDTCIVAAHFSFPKSEGELLGHCKVMQELAEKYHKDGISKVIFVGDFNTSAETIEKVCGSLTNFAPTIRKSGSEPQSCKDNDGTHSENNIDLMVQFRAAEK